MKCYVKTLEGCARLLEIRAEEGELKEVREKVLRDFERVARIPGFRVGKAPRTLVEQHYDKEAREELLKRFIPELYDRALEESRLQAIGLPEISEVHFEKFNFSFKAKIETKPEVPLRRYKGLKVSRKAVSVTPEEIQNHLRAVQEERAELVPKEGAVEENDFVVCDVEGHVDGKGVENRKNVLVYASFKDQKHPELVKALVGAKRGDLREAELTLESPGGVVQKARYQVRINEVKRKNLPEINEEFVKMVSGFQTVKELEEAISKEIQRRKEEETRKNLEKDLLEELRKNCLFDLPRFLIDQEARRVAEDQVFHLKLLGWADQDIQTKITEHKEEFLREAETRVRNSLILEKIAEAEKIEVLPQEIDEKIRALSDRLKRSDKEKGEDLANATLKRRIAGEILFEKAISVVVTHAQVRETS